MHAVVNNLTLDGPLDPTAIEALIAIGPRMREIAGFRGAHLVHVEGGNYIIIVFGDDAAALDRTASAVGNDWITTHVAPHAVTPPQRTVGSVVASVEA